MVRHAALESLAVELHPYCQGFQALRISEFEVAGQLEVSTLIEKLGAMAYLVPPHSPERIQDQLKLPWGISIVETAFSV